MDATAIERIGKRAEKIATDKNHEYITCEHLLLSMLEEDDVTDVLEGLDCDIEQLTEKIEDYFKQGAVPTSNIPNQRPRETEYVNRVIQRGVTQKMLSGRSVVIGRDLLLSLMQEDGIPAAFFIAEQEISATSIRDYIIHATEEDETESEGGGSPFGRPGDDEKTGGKMSDKKADKILAKFTVNLNEEAKDNKIDPLIGRETEVFEITHVAARRRKNNIVMLGEPGVGKTAIAEGLAKLIVEKKTPEILWEAIVYNLDITALIAGTKFRGDFEERMKLVLDALEHKSKTIKPILFIDEIHMIMGAGSGGAGAMDVSNLLKPALAKGKLRCIGSTTHEEFRKHFEKDRALLRRFQTVNIEEPSIEDSKRILVGLQDLYEQFHGVKYTPEALDAAVDLTSRYLHGKFLPDKAIDAMDAAGARQKVIPEADRDIIIREANIEKEVALMGKIPEKTVKEDDGEKLSHLESDLNLVVYGQEPALTILTDAVIQARAGLREIEKPLGCYLFAGPTGVGKTETIKKLAEVLGIPLVRFNMSEYMEKHSIAKLIGSPPGYVGYEDGSGGSGQLINEISKTPYCVLLLDEVEKAHPDIMNILLQIMDDGKLTSGGGKTIDFRNVYLFMTTNAGARDAAKPAIGFGDATHDDKQKEAIEKFFTPEFRNRLDETIYFNKLEKKHIRMVVDKFITELNFQIQDRNVEIKLDDKARDYFANKGYDPLMGARPLGRVIRRDLKKPLSRDMLFGDLKANGGVVRVTTSDVEGKTKLTYTIDPVSTEVKEIVDTAKS